MMAIAGRPMIAHVLERATCLRASGRVAQVVLATSQAERDKPLTWIADDLGVASFCGDEHDVVGRFLAVAHRYGANVVMRLTGDCPLLAPDVCCRVLDDYVDLLEPCVDYVSNDTTSSGYPDGTDCEVMSVQALVDCDRAARVHTDREHVTPWIRRHLATRTVRAPVSHGALKLSVDTPADLAFVRRVFGYLPQGDFSLAATLGAARRAR